MVRRVFSEKKEGFNIEARGLLEELKADLGIDRLENVRILNRYDIEGISEAEYLKARNIVFSEPPVDSVYDGNIVLQPGERMLAIESLPGQYDQRADSAAQCIQLLTCREMPTVRSARIILLKGALTEADYNKIRNYCINPVESREAVPDKPDTLSADAVIPPDVETVTGFIYMDRDALSEYSSSMGFAMSLEDLEFCRDYFGKTEKRDPTITELKVIDTYWSDHCRHTTFLTAITKIEVEDGKYSDVIRAAYDEYLKARRKVYGPGIADGDGTALAGGVTGSPKQKMISLMDVATITAKEFKKDGKLEDLEVSEENNACSIIVKANVGGKPEEWLVMFKNETHNHPTEIEPFGGAATCLGGAIRDPLSGRAYVYQAMRVTGSGDPRVKVEDTIPGKLPQRKITRGAAAGFSSYGNQIGLATGQVEEIYDEGYVAKRLEIGAVIGAVRRSDVLRAAPVKGDVVILLGGRTGRDGCGGATGSSKKHDENSILTCGSEVQKGNPPTERKIQRLFRKSEVSRIIKKCNDFGAGGVSVAIGELASGLDIDLDAVPKKYEGLDGTELAISESQERMAVVVDKKDRDRFIAAAGEENLEAVKVAEVTDSNRLRMFWRDCTIVDISRDFLDTNGVGQYSEAIISAPSEGKNSYFSRHMTHHQDIYGNALENMWENNLLKLSTCSRRGLVERFDSTIGASTILMPFGGKYQMTPSEGMAACLPVTGGTTDTATLMAFGFNPEIGKWSPFHGAVYAVAEAAAKIVAMGGDFSKIRLTLQEYFEKLGSAPAKWGKPLSALLGACHAQKALGIPAIGGKDSMSGTFRDLNVPPSLIAFAVAVSEAGSVVPAGFARAGSKIILAYQARDEYDLPDFEMMKRNFSSIRKLAGSGKIISACTVKAGGMAESISKMCFGNMLGFRMDIKVSDLPLTSDINALFDPAYGSFIIETDEKNAKVILEENPDWILIGETIENPCIRLGNHDIALPELARKWSAPLEGVFPAQTYGKECNCPDIVAAPPDVDAPVGAVRRRPPICLAGDVKPRVFIPVFPGTNCEYDTKRKFEEAGADVDEFVIRNLTKSGIEESISIMVKKISSSQIIAFPGGFSGGDEPEGSGKFIAAVFRNPYIAEAVMDLIKKRDGLILGICNGFQALIKLGLLPDGEIRDLDNNSPTLTFNTIGRHISRIVRTKVSSAVSPWLAGTKPGDIHNVAVSHGEGRFAADEATLRHLMLTGQIATQYVDFEGNPSADQDFNPNGSVGAVEGITSPDGRIFGKMGHSERAGLYTMKNVPGNYDQGIFKAGTDYFK